MATDWSSVPAMVTSGELFDGELFGDELIDIYNSTVAESHGLDVDANGGFFSCRVNVSQRSADVGC